MRIEVNVITGEVTEHEDDLPATPAETVVEPVAEVPVIDTTAPVDTSVGV